MRGGYRGWRLIALLAAALGVAPAAHAEGEWQFKSNGYWQTDMVWVDNVLDLNNKDNDDSFEYIGIAYELGFEAGYREWINGFARFERNGPYDYDAPVLGRRAVRTSSGDVQAYHNQDFLPELEEFYLDMHLSPDAASPLHDWHVKAGLFAVQLGLGFAGTGYYENYGASLLYDHEPWSLMLHYNRPDLNNRWILGDKLQQETTLGRGHQDTVANFWAAHARRAWESETAAAPGGSAEGYLSVLDDRTGVGKRSSLYGVSTPEDRLWTAGGLLQLEWERLHLTAEAARNFGRAEIEGDGEDILHKGYLLYGRAAVPLPEARVTPRAAFLAASGNDPADSDLAETLTGSSNRAFNTFSPTNTNLSDATYQPGGIGPILATSQCDGLMFGIRRPGTFGDAYILENLLAPNVGLEFTPIEPLTLQLDWWYLAAFERGIGQVDGAWKKLSRDLGHEFDFQAEWTVNDHVSVAMTTAYFLPGKYYKTPREDAGTQFSPLIRADGKADPAFYGDIRVTFAF